jgi:peptidoglycan L-alanyl-D-glutamate endopeptidase CwlK
MSRNKETLHPILKDAFDYAFKKWTDESFHYKVILTCADRTKAEQKALYAKGRTEKGKIVTYCDGEKKLSKHNKKPSEAFDIAFNIIGSSRLSWDVCLFEKFNGFVQEYMKKLDNKDVSVVWGGNWNSKFKDNPHYEIRFKPKKRR